MSVEIQDPAGHVRGLADCSILTQAMLAEVEGRQQAITAALADPDLTDEAKARRQHELTQEALAALDQAAEKWERQVSACEAAAQREAAPTNNKGETYQLAYSNGLALMGLLADAGDVGALVSELEAVASRGVSGEIDAWTKGLPLKLQALARTDPGGSIRRQLANVERRCSEIAESRKSATQRRAEARLGYLQQQRDQAGLLRRLNSGSTLRQIAFRLQQRLQA